MEDIREHVRNKYGEIARAKGSCCGPESGCCGSTNQVEISQGIGYSIQDLDAVPDEANLGLGCGNPTALASLKPGDVVVDLGSGGGIDCFLAAKRVGDTGKVVGVDMTADMIDLARKNAEKVSAVNVEFRLGEIENLPVSDNFADVLISNCVINLSPDKARVFKEAYRVLKPGGKMVISDIVLLEQIPESIKESVEAYTGCIAGAMLKEDYISDMESAGFGTINELGEQNFDIIQDTDDPYVKSLIEQFNLTPEQITRISKSIVSLKVEAVK